jgi:RND family efflux transporter MFP subunit
MTLDQSLIRVWAARALAAAGVAGVGLLLLGLAGTFHAKTGEGKQERPTRVLRGESTVKVRQIERMRSETAVGTVKPVHEAAIASRVLARVVELSVNAGQAVRKDDVLVRLDDAELQARVKQLDARLAAVRAAAERAAADLTRTEKLRASNVVSQAEFEQVSATARSTAAEVEQASQALVEARAMLAHTTIVSPFDGLVVEKRVQTGDTVAPGQTLLTMYDPSRMQMVATVRESLASRLQVGQSVAARLDSLGYECHATVSEIVPEAEVASRSFQIKVTGPCPPGIYSGLFGRIEVPLDKETITVVPAAAVRRVGQLELVDVVQGDRVIRRGVRLGRLLDSDYEVLAGLTPGEEVVLSTESQP